MEMDFEILAKYLSKEATEAEIKKIEFWLLENSKNQELLNAYKTAWNLPEKTVETSDLNRLWKAIAKDINASEKTKVNIIDKINDILFGQRINPLLAYSFALLVILVPLLLFIFSGSPEMINFRAVSESPSVVTLSDGSVIKLDRSSVLTYPEIFDESSRKVKLKGEAFFDIMTDPQKPFIIEVENCTVAVLGTSFNIRGWSEKVSVSVLEGKVRFSSIVEEKSKSVILTKNQNSNIEDNGFPSEPISVDPQKSTSWMNGYYDFEAVSVSEVAQQLERWYNVEIKFYNVSKESEIVNISIDKSSLSKNLDLLTPIIGSTYKIENNKVIIK